MQQNRARQSKGPGDPATPQAVHTLPWSHLQDFNLSRQLSDYRERSVPLLENVMLLTAPQERRGAVSHSGAKWGAAGLVRRQEKDGGKPKPEAGRAGETAPDGPRGHLRLSGTWRWGKRVGETWAWDMWMVR